MNQSIKIVAVASIFALAVQPLRAMSAFALPLQAAAFVAAQPFLQSKDISRAERMIVAVDRGIKQTSVLAAPCLAAYCATKAQSIPAKVGFGALAVITSLPALARCQAYAPRFTRKLSKHFRRPAAVPQQ